MADEKIKISELDEASSLSGLYGVGADAGNYTYKFSLDATVNVIEAIKVNGVTQPVTNKTVNITTAVDPEVITNAEIDELFN